jgi:hypothetical protein
VVQFSALEVGRVKLQTPEVSEDVASRFADLADAWSRETLQLSSVTQIVLHPAYQQIIGMGPVVLPLIFARLADRPGHWFWALNAITGQNPVADEDIGNVRRMSYLASVGN